MIEIVQHGNDKFKVTCYICNCVFTYNASDINANGEIICPDCKHKLNHFPSDYMRNSEFE